MDFIYDARQTPGPATIATIGNKAARLAELLHAGYRVPDFVVIGPQACIADAGRAGIEATIRRLCRDDAKVAVRSSSIEEDGVRNSFAGQFATFLNVDVTDVPDRIADVRRSKDSEHLRAYRESNALGDALPTPAVIVQRMVDAECAGVAFGADPVSGDSTIAVVAASRGLGESLVSGTCQGDTWHVDSSRRIVRREIESGEPVLDDSQVRKLAQLVRKIGKHCGRPQDIEWAIDGRHIHLLQSRDITTIGADGDRYALWDNSNIVESYGGVTTPLTFSIAREAYQEAYRHMGRVLGVSEKAIAGNARAYEQMIGLIQGRVYYNLLNWYRLLMLTPGFRFNSRFMEQMMGVTEGLPPEAVPRPQDDSPFAPLRAALGLSRVAWRLVSKLFRHRQGVRRFHDRMDRLLQPIDLQSLSLGGLVDYYEELQGEVIPAWDTPLINDLYCMIFHGALRKLSEKWFSKENADLHNDLVAGEAGIISLEPVRRMRRMARLAACDNKFVSALCTGSTAQIGRYAGLYPEFEAEYVAYLDLFGDRCLDELKLESETLKDNPLPLLRAVGQLARSGQFDSAAALDENRLAAERTIRAEFGAFTLRGALYKVILRLTRSRVRDRENLRFERTRVYGRVRAVFLEVGTRLTELEVLASRDDIFYLNAGEINDFARATGSSISLAALVEARRDEFARYAASEDPPRRFITRGPAQLPSAMQPVTTAADTVDATSRHGQACSPGIVRGRVKVVRDPRTADVRQGEILVAQRTDPGWVTIFPLVSGMIMERGSLLSHSAIVARELGLPCVVAVDDACSWLRDGDWVELDGAGGTIRILERMERAA